MCSDVMLSRYVTVCGRTLHEKSIYCYANLSDPKFNIDTTQNLNDKTLKCCISIQGTQRLLRTHLRSARVELYMGVSASEPWEQSAFADELNGGHV